MDDIYREHILDHYKNPRNFGELKGRAFSSHEANVSCGDDIEIFLQFKKRKGKFFVKDIKFKGNGCALSMASASMLTEEVKGKEVCRLGRFNEDYIFKLFGMEVSAGRRKCILLPLRALERTLDKVEF
jgi:nitrogen fixation NifU-like protein